MLSGEIGWLTQQLGLRDSDSTGCLSDEHSVVELCSSRSGWAQVSALGTRGERTVQMHFSHFCLIPIPCANDGTPSSVSHSLKRE